MNYYRLLNPDEKVEYGDEWYDEHRREWCDVPVGSGLIRRRPLYPKVPADAYLHYWDEEKDDWVSEDESKRHNHGALSFPDIPGDNPANAYPWGYKLWKHRKLRNAPEWVHAAKAQRLLEQFGFDEATQRVQDKQDGTS
jgi:hypothetical protein